MDKTISGEWYSWGSSFFSDPPEPSKRRPIKAQLISLISIVRVEKTSHLNVFGHRIPDIGLTNFFRLIGYTHSVFANSWNNADLRNIVMVCAESIHPLCREWQVGSLIAWCSWDISPSALGWSQNLKLSIYLPNLAAQGVALLFFFTSLRVSSLEAFILSGRLSRIQSIPDERSGLTLSLECTKITSKAPRLLSLQGTRNPVAVGTRSLSVLNEPHNLPSGPHSGRALGQ